MKFRHPESEFINDALTLNDFVLKQADFISKIKTLIIAAACLAVACATTQSRRGGILIADSKSYEASIYRQNCAVCHGAEANGKEVNGVLTPSLRYGDIEKKSEAEIYTQIHDGKLPMPAFKFQMTDAEIKRMVTFIRRDLQGKAEDAK